MGNPFLRYLDGTGWTDNIDQARALNVEDFADEVMGALTETRAALASVIPLAQPHPGIPGDPGPRTARP